MLWSLTLGAQSLPDYQVLFLSLLLLLLFGVGSQFMPSSFGPDSVYLVTSNPIIWSVVTVSARACISRPPENSYVYASYLLSTWSLRSVVCLPFVDKLVTGIAVAQVDLRLKLWCCAHNSLGHAYPTFMCANSNDPRASLLSTWEPGCTICWRIYPRLAGLYEPGDE